MRTIIAAVLAFTLHTAVGLAQSPVHVEPEGLGVAADFPGTPEYTETTGDDGGTIRTYAVKSPAAAYDLTIWDLPEGAVGPGDIDRLLDNMRDQSIAGIRATLKNETKMDIGGNKARDLTADVMGMVWRSRVAIVNNKIYQIVAIIATKEEQSPSTVDYLNSFKLTDAAGAAAKK